MACCRGAIELRLEVQFNQQAQSFYESLGMETQSRTMSMSLEGYRGEVAFAFINVLTLC